MFTGLIQEVGTVRGVRRSGGGVTFTIDAQSSSPQLSIHDSVAVNGVCLTVVSVDGGTFSCEAVEETLRKTTLGGLKTSSRVNLELALRMGDRLGGHFVQGHVDCVGTIVSLEKKASSWLVTVEFPEEFARYVIPVGSIAVDGISLTTASVEGNRFVVSLIGYTLENTTFMGVGKGQLVNLEFDMVGKYVQNLVQAGEKGKDGLTREKLREWGYDG
ncbi:MAG: riboflavin synthase [Bacteroidota bacterium]